MPIEPSPLDFYDDPANSVGYLTRIAFRQFSRHLERRTLSYGVTSGHWPFLRVLWNEEGMSQSELSRRVGMKEPTTVTALNAMEKAGFVRREPSTRDRRKMHIHLTDRGRALRQVMIAAVTEVNELASAGVSAEDMATLRKVLARLAANLEKDEFTPPVPEPLAGVLGEPP